MRAMPAIAPRQSHDSRAQRNYSSRETLLNYRLEAFIEPPGAPEGRLASGSAVIANYRAITSTEAVDKDWQMVQGPPLDGRV